LDTYFDYAVPDALAEVEVGTCVLVDFAHRPVVGYVVGLAEKSDQAELKEIEAVLGGPYFSADAAQVARWIADEYMSPLSEAVRLFTPPGGVPRAVRRPDGAWELRRAGVGPVDDRWASLAPAGKDFVPGVKATTQRAVLDALASGPVRVPELAAELGSVDAALKALERAGAVVVERRRRMRDAFVREVRNVTHVELTPGQQEALAVISAKLESGDGVVALDGVTGSGKTEVYLRAIERVLADGGTACVLVPEISLTPQTVGRFRARFGDEVAVLHSRLTAGERFDQWDQVRSGRSRIVVGARSALFAPMKDLRLIVIDEEHESSYKQGQAPRYHAREVAEYMVGLNAATLVLGSASLSMEARRKAETGRYALVRMPARVGGRDLPSVTVVDMAAEFADGHRSMFSRPLGDALRQVKDAAEKAVLFLNRRGFASFLLCRECGFVPRCESCSTSLTYHEVGSRLMCHHCGSTHQVPATCPSCGSPYLRQFGAGTQRVEAELNALLPGWPVVRMDADTTKGRGAHDRLLASFEALDTGVLLGTQMIAKGLDYPDVTLVGVVAADITLNLPDFRAGERTYQLLEQVAGRAGRGTKPGNVVLQTYWSDHRAIVAAAAHKPDAFYEPEALERRELGYPPFGRLCNVLVWGDEGGAVGRVAGMVAEELQSSVPEGWSVVGPSPAPLSRLKRAWRWHVLVKAPEGCAMSSVLGASLARVPKVSGVSVVADVDPTDLL
jgi:primosomal protein N' (replication factor Y)